MTDKEKLEEIRKIVLFNMKVTCGNQCGKMRKDCSCQNKTILDIIEKEI